jgi:enoyl-CoA hydratase/carnithine racemase
VKDDLGTHALRLEREGPLAWCVIDRPAARNALTPAMYFGIKRAVRLVNADAELAALIITGTGDVFAPGGDLGGRSEPGEALPEGLAEDVLPAHVGVGVARDLLLSARRFDAVEALRLGVISRVVPHDDLRAAAVQAAVEVSRSAPEARMHVKRMLDEHYGRVDHQTMFWALEHSSEPREGMQTFMERRAPSWVPAGWEEIAEGRERRSTSRER